MLNMKSTSTDYLELINTMYKLITIGLQKIFSKVAEMDLSSSLHFLNGNGEASYQLSNKVNQSPSVVTGVCTSLPPLLFFYRDEQRRHRKSMDVKQSPSVVTGVCTSLPPLLFFSRDEQRRHRKSMDVKQSPSVMSRVGTSLSSLLFYFDGQKNYQESIAVKKSPSVVAVVRTSLPPLIFNFINIMLLIRRDVGISPNY